MDKAQQRKSTPVFTGFMCYFPRAIRYVAQVSLAGNKQHHADKPLHWDMSKSTDEKDALARHLLDVAQGIDTDEDDILHEGKVCWRALANLERKLIDIENAC